MSVAEKALPEAIQKQIDAAEKIEAGLSVAPQPDSTPEPEPQPEPEVDSTPAPQEDVTSRIGELERQLQSTSVEQGRVRALTQQLKEAQTKIDELSAQPAPEPPKVVSNAQRELLVSDYGTDLVEYMENFAINQVGQLRNDVKKVENATGEIQLSQQESATGMFWTQLGNTHADWQKLQSTKAGQDFLLSPVPYGNGRTFDNLLQDAASTLNAQAAIDVFDGMKKYIRRKGNPQDKLNGQIVPGQGPGGNPPQQNAKPMIFADDVRNASIEYAKNGSMEIPAKYGANNIDEWDEMLSLAAVEGRLK